MCLPNLPGHAPRGTKDRAGQARLSLAELDATIGKFIVANYHQHPHSETGQPPQARRDATGFLPHPAATSHGRRDRRPTSSTWPIASAPTRASRC